jgi:hypothetical protein
MTLLGASSYRSRRVFVRERFGPLLTDLGAALGPKGPSLAPPLERRGPQVRAGRRMTIGLNS